VELKVRGRGGGPGERLFERTVKLVD